MCNQNRGAQKIAPIFPELTTPLTQQSMTATKLPELAELERLIDAGAPDLDARIACEVSA